MNTKIKIFIADDETRIADSLSRMLKLKYGKDKLDIVSYDDGLPVLEEIKKNNLPDIMVTDRNMKELHGLELIKEIRAMGLKFRIFLVTTQEPDDIMPDVTFISKPYDDKSLAPLYAAIEALIESLK